MKPTFTGRFATDREAGLWSRRWHVVGFVNYPLFTFHNDRANPLTLADRYGNRWRPNRTFDKFDFGSVPLMVQGFVSPLMSPEAFALHDSGYEFHGLWRVIDGREDEFVEMGRGEVDVLCLRDGLEASGASRSDRERVYRMVRLFGRHAWARAEIGNNAVRADGIPVTDDLSPEEK